MAASAIERMVVPRSSISASDEHVQVPRPSARRRSIQRALCDTTSGITSKDASARVSTADDGGLRDRQRDQGRDRDGRQADEEQRSRERPPIASPGSSLSRKTASSGRLRRRSSSGRSDASSAARTPPPKASAIAGQCTTRCAADREREREVVRDLVEHDAREHVAEHQPDAATPPCRATAPGTRRSSSTCRGGEALHAQLGDEAPALGDRQQHRVEREQEADHRADRGEQARSTGRSGRPPAAAAAARRRPARRQTPRRELRAGAARTCSLPRARLRRAPASTARACR